MNCILILGNQLFDPRNLKKYIETQSPSIIYMREDFELCTYYKFHKHKILFFLSAMRSFADELKSEGFNVHYEALKKSPKTYEENFIDFLKSHKIQNVFSFEIEDHFFEKRLKEQLQTHKITFQTWPSPMFLTRREEFQEYLSRQKRPFMKTFYEAQRKRLKILVQANGTPVGGQWSFDTENRLKLPDAHHPPLPFLPKHSPSLHLNEVRALIDEHFADHPGECSNFRLPVNRRGAQQWLQKFLQERLSHFGPYEDAIPSHSEFVYHSLLTPFLNTGLLTPEEVIQQTLNYSQRNHISIGSTEGFIRQIIGWREFIRGIYQNYRSEQETSNFWNHHRKLAPCWWEGKTGIPPLDDSIRKNLQYGYAHHIERLMIQGSLMLLLEIHPHEAYRWFMEMYIDSSDWVMVPNVFGMALFSDGGTFATKPYICGSNYYRKMGSYKVGTWCTGVDGLYWQFIEKHQAFFSKNPRLSMMSRQIQRMDSKKKKTLFEAADQLRDRLTQGF